jgi:hypothetical protein
VQQLDKKQGSRKPLRRRAYNVAKVPARFVRDRYLYRLARKFFDEAVAESQYEMADLERVREYLEYAFRRRTPEYPDPGQRPVRYFPGLKAQPVWDPNEFDFLATLVQQRHQILDELNAYRGQHDLAIHHQRLNDAGKWSVFYLHAAGTPNPEALELFPVATSATADIPGMGVVGQAYFSVLDPGTHIPAHHGPTNTKLRLQLRLDVPEGCEMRVGDHMHKWDDGHEIVVFDDSYDHEVWIRGNRERSVLILDFWHPDLTEAELWALETLDGWMPDRRRYKSRVKGLEGR